MVKQVLLALIVFLSLPHVARADDLSFARVDPHAELATSLNVSALQPGKPALVAVVLAVDPKHHAQSHTPLEDGLIAFEVKFDPNPALVFGQPVYPTAEIKTYPAIGKVSVYDGRVIVYVPIEVKPDAKPGDIELTGTASFQICDDKVCFGPTDAKLSVKTRIVEASAATTPVQPDIFKDYASRAAAQPATKPAKASSATRAANEAQTIWWALGTAMLAGLIFNIMPCVLPVLPIKALGFYEVSQHHRSRCIMLGLVFSAGMIATFTTLGLFVLVLKSFTWGEMFTNPAFIWSLVALLVAMAVWLFGAFETGLPSFVYQYSPRHDTVSGNFLWGGFTAILATPCTAPLLPPLLLWAATRPGYIGVPAIAFVGVGMAIPYVILSAFPELARKFPRTGPWPSLFKQMMAFLVLASAAVFAGGRLIDGANFWWAPVPIVAIAALYLVARTVQLTKGALAVGIASTLAVALLGGTIAWAAKVTGTFAGGASGSSTEHHFTPYTPDAFAAARASGKIVLVKFTANWCLTCQYIEGSVFRDEAVWGDLKRKDVVVMKVDLTHANPDGTALLKTLNPAGGIPLTALYRGTDDDPAVLSSVYSSADLLDALAKLTPSSTRNPS